MTTKQQLPRRWTSRATLKAEAKEMRLEAARLEERAKALREAADALHYDERPADR